MTYEEYLYPIFESEAKEKLAEYKKRVPRLEGHWQDEVDEDNLLLLAALAHDATRFLTCGESGE